MATKQKDNSTFRRKAALRTAALGELHDPVILETHGGYGKLWERCYRHVGQGVVFENQGDDGSIEITRIANFFVNLDRSSCIHLPDFLT